MPDVFGPIERFSEVIKGLATVEQRLDMMSLLAKYQDALAEVGELKDENKRLREELAWKKRSEWIGPELYIVEDDGGKTGPICPECFKEEIISMLADFGSKGVMCARCRKAYAGVEASVQGRSAKVTIA